MKNSLVLFFAEWLILILMLILNVQGYLSDLFKYFVEDPIYMFLGDSLILVAIISIAICSFTARKIMKTSVKQILITSTLFIGSYYATLVYVLSHLFDKTFL